MRHAAVQKGIITFNRFSAGVILALLLVFMLYLCGASLFETVYISMDDISGEKVETLHNNFFLNLIKLALILSALYIFFKNTRHITLRRIETLMLCLTVLFGFTFIFSCKLSAPWYTDSYIVTYAAHRASVGDFSQFDNYFVRFPFQLGYVLYSEIFFRVGRFVLRSVPDGYLWLALQGMNVIWLALGYYALVSSCGLLFHNERVQKQTALLLIFCTPPVMSCTFLYGNIPAFSCGLLAVWMFLLYINTNKIHNALLCILFLVLAVTLKLNLLIFCLAIGIVWLLESARKLNVKGLVCLVLMAVCVITIPKLPQKIYEQRCDCKFGDGIPMLAWLAMGLDDGYAGPGWYSQTHTVNVFTDSGNDPEATAESAMEFISDRSREFAAAPSGALKFFSEKLKSVWNDPSFESLWINDVQNSFGEKGFLYNLLCGDNSRRTHSFMDVFQQLIYLGIVLGLALLWRNRSPENCLLALIILGGMLYHLLFEAKSQYALPYFVLMVPLAACGFDRLFKLIEDR